MVNGDRRAIRHDRLLGVGLLVGFLVVVGAAVAAYLVSVAVFHIRLRVIVPALIQSARMPAIGPAELVLAAAIGVMTVAFIALLIHDARGSRPTNDTPARPRP